MTTRGKYYPDKALATDTEPPLYLHISATTKESLEKAVVMIEDMIQNATLPAPTPHPAERREVNTLFLWSSCHDDDDGIRDLIKYDNMRCVLYLTLY